MNKLSEISAEAECLKLKKTINENHRLAQTAAADAVERAVLAGGLLSRWKELLPHGRFESFVETHFEGSVRTAQKYMQATKRLSAMPKAHAAALLKSDASIAGLLGSVKKPKSNTSRKGAAPAGVTDDQEPDFSTGEEASTEAPGKTPQENGHRPPRNGTDKPVQEAVDYGKCPACASTKWTEDEFGVSCAKCNQPWGEPAGEVDEDQVKNLRTLIRKHLEAATRGFDDLQDIAPSKIGQHGEAIRLCKAAMQLEKTWDK